MCAVQMSTQKFKLHVVALRSCTEPSEETEGCAEATLSRGSETNKNKNMTLYLSFQPYGKAAHV